MKSQHRYRDGPGCTTQVRHFSPFNGLLWKVSGSIVNEPRPKKSTARKGKAKITDDQVRELRRLHEHEHESVASLATRYDLSIAYVTQLVNYQVRIRYTT